MSEITMDGYVTDMLRMQVRLAEQHLAGETDKDGLKLGRQAVNAYTKALDKWARGVRPASVGGGEYTVPSVNDAGVVYLTSADHCTCDQHRKNLSAPFCWHQALIIGVELAADGLDRDDAIPLPEPQYDLEEWFG